MLRDSAVASAGCSEKLPNLDSFAGLRGRNIRQVSQPVEERLMHAPSGATSIQHRKGDLGTTYAYVQIEYLLAHDIGSSVSP